MAPGHTTRFDEFKIFGRKTPAQIGVVFFERDDDSFAVRTMATYGGLASKSIHKHMVRQGRGTYVVWAGAEWMGVNLQSEVFFSCWNGAVLICHDG